MKRQDLLQQLVENFQNMYRGMLQKRDYQQDGIPFGQKSALFTIALHQATNVKQIASFLHVTSGAATQHIEALVQEGLVERTNDPNDRRNVVITLSRNGKDLMKKLKQDRLSMIEELFSDISDAELAAYNRVMEKVNLKINAKEVN